MLSCNRIGMAGLRMGRSGWLGWNRSHGAIIGIVP